MIIGIILAAGRGTRIKSKASNKVTLPFLNKPLIIYAVELMQAVCDKTVVVIGAFHETVRDVLKGFNLVFANQKDQLGTAHAVKVALTEINKLSWSPTEVLIGYGDHTMFYKKETIKKLIDLHRKEKAAVSLLTFEYDYPDKIKYGRIIRDKSNFVIDIVEQKDATPEQRLIKEVNPGFYCINFKFILENINLIQKSPVSGEFYITDIVKIAASQKQKIVGLKAEFSEVGLGVNTAEELSESEKIYLSKSQN